MKNKRILALVLGLILAGCAGGMIVSKIDLAATIQGAFSGLLKGTLTFVQAKRPDLVAPIEQYMGYAYTDITTLISSNSITASVIAQDVVNLFNQINSKLEVVDPAYAAYFVSGATVAAGILNTVWKGVTTPADLSLFAGAVANGIKDALGGVIPQMRYMAQAPRAVVPGPFYVSGNLIGLIGWKSKA